MAAINCAPVTLVLLFIDGRVYATAIPHQVHGAASDAARKLPNFVQLLLEGIVSKNANSSAVVLSWAQGLYFLTTGVWPIVSVDTFQRVTGRKSDHLIADPPTEADHWMLNTISILNIAISLVLLSAARRRRVSFEVALLGVLLTLVFLTNRVWIDA